MFVLCCKSCMRAHSRAPNCHRTLDIKVTQYNHRQSLHYYFIIYLSSQQGTKWKFSAMICCANFRRFFNIQMQFSLYVDCTLFGERSICKCRRTGWPNPEILCVTVRSKLSRYWTSLGFPIESLTSDHRYASLSARLLMDSIYFSLYTA